MSDTFVYEELDLQSPSFRLIRLYGGHEGPIECELLHAYVGDDEAGMEYEALSYTWGDLDKPHGIIMNGQVMHITKNLFDVLEHLRFKYKDRFLWIDALCINQQDYKERGHQVQQMASIYERARQVIFWLGMATKSTDCAFEYLRMFEKAALNFSCNNWQPSDERWGFVWSTVGLQFRRIADMPASIPPTDFESLLNRSWFNRIWIIQEVAKARSARVVCGTKSVSARIFALLPTLTGIKPSPQCQAILDIMPGPSRRFSWWLTDQDLETLLRKFAGSQASDPRDMIYALLGISSDLQTSESLTADYRKTMEEVDNDVMAFLLKLENVGISSACLPPLRLSVFLREFPSFRDLRREVIIDMFNGQIKSKLWKLSRHDVLPTTQFLRPRWKKMQTVEEVEQGLRSPGKIGWSLLLDTDPADTAYLDSLSLEGEIPIPLVLAARMGSEDMMEHILANDTIYFSPSNQVLGDLLYTLIRAGYSSTIQLLLRRQDIDLNSRDRFGQTPLHSAVVESQTSIARMLLETGRVNVNLDSRGRAPFGAGLLETSVSMFELLPGFGGVEVPARALSGRPPLIVAAEMGFANMVELLLEFREVDVDARNQFGLTALLVAAENGHTSTVNILLRSLRCDVNAKDVRGYTPLVAAVNNDHTSVVELLLARSDVDLEPYKIDWTAPLVVEAAIHPLLLAIRNNNKAIVKMLLQSGKMEMSYDNVTALMSKACVPHRSDIRALLQAFANKQKTVSQP